MKMRVLLLALAAVFAAAGVAAVLTFVNLPPHVVKQVKEENNKDDKDQAEGVPEPKEPEEVFGPAEKMPTLQTSEAVNEFGLRLFRALLEKRGQENTVFYPSLTAQTTAVLGLGASGKCRTELTDYTGFAGLSEKNGELSLIFEALGNEDLKVRSASSLWVRPGAPVKPLFAAQAKALCKAEANTLDPRNPAEAINTWFTRRCGIGKVVSNRDMTNVRVVLASAMTLEGNYSSPFEKADDGSFILSTGKLVSTKMVRGKKKVRFTQLNDWSGVAIPVEGGAHLCVILPERGKKLFETASKLQIEEVMKLTKEPVKERLVVFPKVSLRNTLDLKRPCRVVGLRSMFILDSEDPPFRFIVDGEAALSYFRQKCELDIDEGGFRGKAAESSGLTARSIDTGPSFFATRPFLVFVVNKESVIIAIAAVEDPRVN